MVLRYDAVIEDSQALTKGTAHLLAVDFVERNGQSFTVSSATFTIYDPSDDTAVDADLTAVECTVTTGELTGEVRVQALLSVANTNLLSAGRYYVIWSLTLNDGQTRMARQGLRVRTLP